eukprot:SAG31_NODE_690_length_12796_cov_4.634559_16_plen_137_part_00
MHGGLRRALWPPRAMGAAALRRSWHGSTVCSRAPVDFTTLVTDKHRGLVRRQRTLLAELRQAIVSVNADDADLRLLDETSQHLDDLFLLCVVGPSAAPMQYNAMHSPRKPVAAIALPVVRHRLMRDATCGDPGSVT